MLGLAGGIGAALPSASQNGGQDDDLSTRVEALETSVKKLEAYAKAQAKAAEVLSAKLDDAEEEGFTYGINANSRVVLLEGLRKTAKAAQTDVPGVEEEESEEDSGER